MEKSTQGELRGSQKLLHGLAKNGEAPSIDAIKKAFSLPMGKELRIPNWLIRGIPPHYLHFEGTFETPLSHLSELISKFVALNDNTINLHILINGIPFPDIAQVIVRNTPGAR